MAGLNVPITVTADKAKKEIQAFNRELKTVEQTYKMTAAELEANGRHVEALTAKEKSLVDQLKLRETITAKTKEQYIIQGKVVEEYSNKVAEASKALQNVKLADPKQAEENIKSLKAALSEAKNEINQNADEVKKLKKELSEAEKEYKNNVSSVKKHETALANATKQYEKNVVLLDRYEFDIKKSESAERLLQASLADTSKELKAQAGHLQQASQYVEEFAASYQKGAQSVQGITNAMSKTGTALTIGITAPLTAAAAAALAAGQEINKNLANIATLDIDTSRLDELKTGIQDIAISAGRDTTDIADGVYAVISAFDDSADTLKKTEINAKSASAGMATLQDSMRLTVAVTKGYNDTSLEATQKASDLALKTMQIGETTYAELANSIGKVVPASNMLKISQEELFNVFATLTGVTGTASEVATEYSAVLTALMQPSAELAKILEEQGYSSGIAAVKTLGFKGALDMLVSATHGSEEALVKLVGRKEAVTAMFALTGAQSKAYADNLVEMQNALGSTDKAFKAQTEGVNAAGFSFQQSMARMQVAAQNFAETMSPVVETAADIVEGITEGLSSMGAEGRNAVVAIGALVMAVGPLLSVSSKVVSIVAGLKGAMAANAIATTATTTATVAAGTAASGAAVGFSALLGPIGWVGAALVGITALVDYLNSGYERQAKKVKELSDEYEQLQSDVGETETKLKNVADKIDVLKSKGKLEIVEQDELKKLEDINEQLEIQLKIQKDLADVANKKREEETVKLLDKKVDTWRGSTSEHETGTIEKLTVPERVQSNIEYYKELQEAIKELEKAQLDLADKGETTSFQFSHNAELVKAYKENMEDLREAISEDSNALIDYKENLSGATEDGKKWIAVIDDTLAAVGAYIDALNAEEAAMNAVTNAGNAAAEGSGDIAESTDKATESLTAATKSFEELIEKYNAGGIDSKKFVESLKEQIEANRKLAEQYPALADDYNRIADIMERRLNKTPEYLDEIKKSTSGLLSETNTLTSAFEEQAKSQEISSKTAMNLIDSGYALALAIDNETGKVTLNERAYKDLIKAKIQDQITTLESSKRTELIGRFHDEREAAGQAALSLFGLARAKALEAEASTKSYQDINAQIELLKKELKSIDSISVSGISKKQQSSSSSDNSRSKELEKWKEANKIKEEDMKNLVDKQKFYNQISTEEEIEAYNEILKFLKEQKDKAVKLSFATADEKAAIARDYAAKIESYERLIYTAEQKIHGDALKDWEKHWKDKVDISKEWIDEQKFYNKTSVAEEITNEIAEYDKLIEYLRDAREKANKITYASEEEKAAKLKEVDDSIKDAERQRYSAQAKLRENELKDWENHWKDKVDISKDWIDKQKYYNQLSIEDEIAEYDKLLEYLRSTQAEIDGKTFESEEEKSAKSENISKSIENAERQKYAAQKKLKEEEIKDIDNFNNKKEKAFQKDLSQAETANQKLKAYSNLRKSATTKLNIEIDSINDKFWLNEKQRLDEIEKVYEEHAQTIEDIDKKMNEVRKVELTNYADKWYETEKKKLDDGYQSKKDTLNKELQAVRDYYSALEREENRTDRNKELSELHAQAEMYQWAATKEGQDKYKSVMDRINDLQKEAQREALREEQKRLEDDIALRAEYLDEAHEQEQDGLKERYNKMKDSAEDLAKSTSTNMQLVAEQTTSGLESIFDSYDRGFDAFSEKTLKDVKKLATDMSAILQGVNLKVGQGAFLYGAQNNVTNNNARSSSVVLNDYGTKNFSSKADISDFWAEQSSLSLFSLSNTLS